MQRLQATTTSPAHRRNLHLAHPPEDLRPGVMRVDCRFGLIQLSARDDRTCLDLQTRGYDTEGYEYRRHAYLTLSTRELCDLRDVLSAMLALRMPAADRAA